MRATLFVLAVFGAALLAGCATTQGLPVEDRRRTFDAPTDTVVSAVVATLTNEGYSIDQLDRAAGLVTTDTRKTFGVLSGLDRTSVTAQVDGRGEGARVTLTISTRQEGGLMPGSRMTEDQAQEAYDQLFASIAEQLN
ncbi:MAG: hypothetical protein ABEL97_03850 [Salinibacter sp.]